MSGNLSVPPDAGVIATLVRGAQVVAIHETGTPSEALRKVIRRCDRYGWKIRTLSSPVTIFRDLNGPRASRASQRGDMFNDHGEPPVTRVDTPEQAMLSRFDRGDLLYGS